MQQDMINGRANFANLGKAYPVAEGTVVESETLAQLPCYWLDNTRNEARETFIVYIHGGGFCLGGIDSHRALLSHIVAKTGLKALFIDYGLAPENPYPTALNHVVEVIQTLAEQRGQLNFIAVGDSAGGGLIATAMPQWMGLSGVEVESCILISPWLDLSCSADSYVDKAEQDPILSRATLQKFCDLYLGGQILSELSSEILDEANPITRMDKPFPPTLLMVGENEVLLDDSKLAYEKISAQQQRVSLSVYPGQTHVWPLDSIANTATVQALAECALWCR